jgi:hypothetical protein
MTFENTTRFLDFQAEYEGSIPPHPLQYFLERWPRAPGFILTNAATCELQWMLAQEIG